MMQFIKRTFTVSEVAALTDENVETSRLGANVATSSLRKCPGWQRVVLDDLF